MGYTGDRLGRAASDSIGLLKSVANFSKKPEEAAAEPIVHVTPAPAPVRTPVQSNDATVISVNVELSGTITSPDELHVHGKIDGNVRAASIIIRASGVVRGEVVAETVVVHGTVEGRIHGQKVQLVAGATVRGDIIHNSLGVDPSAIFEGSSRRSQDAIADAPAFSAITKKSA
jgi:cytoskeletal protein CcmA (bactofilin family)